MKIYSLPGFLYIFLQVEGPMKWVSARIICFFPLFLKFREKGEYSNSVNNAQRIKMLKAQSHSLF